MQETEISMIKNMQNSDKPNVVFIIADQHRGDFTSWGNNGRIFTPCLDELAKRGMIFENAYCTSPLCSPSRAAIASGRYGMNSGCFTNLHELPPGTPSFVSQFRQHGYTTAAFGKTHMEIHAYDSDLSSEAHREYMNSLGWDYICEVSGNGMFKTGIKCAYSEYLREQGMLDEVLYYYRRWRYFMDGPGGFQDFHSETWPFDEKYQETSFIARSAMEWLSGHDRSQPFFMHIGFAAPHSPVEPNPRFLELYGNIDETSPYGAEADADMIRARKGYRAMISQIDFQVGEIYNLLEKQGLADNTIFVYTADHGEMAGDHNRTGKVCFYEGSMRVPLLISGPGIGCGSSEALVELIDLGSTLCLLCNVPCHDLDQGKSLLRVLTGESAQHRQNIYAEMGCDRMLFDGRYKLMYGDPISDTRQLRHLHLDKPVNIPPSPVRLYDLHHDPYELDDLSQKPESANLLAAMKENLLIRINENIQAAPLKDRGAYHPLNLKENSRKQSQNV